MVAARRPESWRAEIRADFRRPRRPRDWARLAAWAVAAYGLVAPVIRMTVGYDTVGFPVTLVAALVAIVWIAPRAHELRTWISYAAAIFFFTQLRDAADETSIQASTGYVLDWELWMFGGVTPSAWLQDRIGGGEANLGVLAYISTIVHWSWFIFPHAVVFGTFFVARRLFSRMACIMAASFYFAVVLYYLVPTIPPWLAVEQGATTGISRIVEDVGATLLGQSLSDKMFELVASPNPRAAMPSLHFAAAFAVVIMGVLLRSPRLLVGALTYCLALAFALIYLGEHYFADILAGGASGLTAVFLAETALGNGPGARVLGRIRARAAAARGVTLPSLRQPPLPDRATRPARREMR